MEWLIWLSTIKSLRWCLCTRYIIYINCISDLAAQICCFWNWTRNFRWAHSITYTILLSCWRVLMCFDFLIWIELIWRSSRLIMIPLSLRFGCFKIICSDISNRFFKRVMQILRWRTFDIFIGQILLTKFKRRLKLSKITSLNKL